MLKNLLDKGKCFVGIHEGEWSFIKDKDCTRLRICSRCATESRKVEHNLGEWDYVRDGHCEQQQTCSRCDLATQREVHVWQEPERRSEESCEQVIVCSRCNAEKEGPQSHLWGDWAYVTPDACGQIQTCERCNASGAKRTEHLWGEWHHSEQHGGAVHVCRRCGEFARSTQAQILSIISSLSNKQAPVPRQIAGPESNRELNVTDDPESAARHAQLETMNAAITEQFEKVRAQMNALDAGPLSQSEAAAKEELAEQFEQLKMQMNTLNAKRAALPTTKPETKKRTKEEIDFEKLKLELNRFNEMEKALAGIMKQVANSLPSAEAGTQGASSQAELDARLVGHWRFTETSFGATDYHRVLQTDGSFADSSHSVSQFGESRTGPEPGEWRTRNKVLYLNYSDGRSLTLEYQLDRDTLFFPGARVQRLWQRVR
jgi:hypothetical protein